MLWLQERARSLRLRLSSGAGQEMADMSKLKERILFTILGMILGGVLTLGVLFVVAWFQFRTGAAVTGTKVQLEIYTMATTNFFEMAGRWPASSTELVSNSMGVKFIESLAPDGWGREVVYEPYTTNRGFGRVLSYGRDGRPGGVGPDADIEVRFP